MSTMRLSILGALIMVLGVVGQSRAMAFTLYEPFAADIYTSGNSILGLNGGTGFATGTAGQWTESAAVTFTVTATTGLTFAPGYNVSGNAAQFDITGGGESSYNYAYRRMDLATTPTNTLWFSLLYRADATDTTFKCVGIGHQDGSYWLNGYLVVAFSERSSPGKGVVGLNGVPSTTTVGPPLTNGTTYLMLSRATGTGGNYTDAKLWVLTAAQYTAVAGMAGGFTVDANIDANSTESAQMTGSAPIIAVSDFLRVKLRGTNTFTIDEIRAADTLYDIMPAGAPPSVAITAPASGFTCGQGMAPVSLTATTTDGTPNTVTGVEFFDTIASVQTKLGDAAGGGSWAFSWTTSAATLGTHSITAKATDGGGWTATSAPIIIKVWIPGDATGNGLVDGLDYNAWQNGYQQPNATFATGDYDGNGQVDGLDYNVWQNNYNHTAVYQADEFGPMAAAGTASTPTGAAPVAPELATMAQPTAVMIAGGPASASAPHLVAVTPAAGATVSGVAGLTLVFDSAVQAGAGAVEVSGMATGQNRDFTQAYDGATKSLVITWAQPLAADVYTVRVVADFVVGADGGAPLDGEVGDPAAPTSPSGDGTPGGDAVLEFEVE